jgi:hypothetical protein
LAWDLNPITFRNIHQPFQREDSLQSLSCVSQYIPGCSTDLLIGIVIQRLMDQVQQSGIALQHCEQSYRVVPGQTIAGLIMPGLILLGQHRAWAIRTIAGSRIGGRLLGRSTVCSTVRRTAISRQCILDTFRGIRTEQRSKEGSEGEENAHRRNVLSWKSIIVGLGG